MRVKCVICDKIESINDETLVAKRLRNRPIHTYMCDECAERIEKEPTREKLQVISNCLNKNKIRMSGRT